MRKLKFVGYLAFSAALLCAIAARTGTSTTKEISLEALRDKIAGGWAGQMIGVSYGAPTEFRYRATIDVQAPSPSRGSCPSTSGTR